MATASGWGGTRSARHRGCTRASGLQSDPLIALERAAGLVEAVGAKAGIEDVLHSTIGIADGERLYAIRYSTASEPPSLFLSRGIHAIARLNREGPAFSGHARAVVSEPLGQMTAAWDPIPPATAITVTSGAVKRRPFRPA